MAASADSMGQSPVDGTAASWRWAGFDSRPRAYRTWGDGIVTQKRGATATTLFQECPVVWLDRLAMASVATTPAASVAAGAPTRSASS
jgi:hypothetical protein